MQITYKYHAALIIVASKKVCCVMIFLVDRNLPSVHFDLVLRRWFSGGEFCC